MKTPSGLPTTCSQLVLDAARYPCVTWSQHQFATPTATGMPPPAVRQSCAAQCHAARTVGAHPDVEADYGS